MEYLKSVEVNTIRVINKNFPELSQQGNKVEFSYYESAKKYLKLLLRTNNHKLGLKIQESHPSDDENLVNKHIEAMGSLHMYYQFIEKSLTFKNSQLKIEKTKVVTDYTASKLDKRHYLTKMRREFLKI